MTGEQLNEGQKKMIEATLKRIRGGLGRFSGPLPEPAYIFVAEAQS
jgi:hypothetical protein